MITLAYIQTAAVLKGKLMQIRFKKLHPAAVMPKRATDGAAGNRSATHVPPMTCCPEPEAHAGHTQGENFLRCRR